MRATRIAQRDGADEALLVDPEGDVLEAPTSTLFWVDSDGNLHTPELGRRRARLDHPRADHAAGARDRGRRAASSRTCSAPRRCSSPRRCARCRASRRSTGSSSPARARSRRRVAGPAGRAHPGRDLRRAQLRRRMNLDLTDEQRLIRETARDFADREIIPRARDNDRARALRPRARQDASPTWATWARRSPRSTAAAASTTSATAWSWRRSGAETRPRARSCPCRPRWSPGSIEQWGTEEQKQRDPAQALLGRVARLLRADRAGHRARTRPRSRPARRARTAAGRSPARRCSSRSATTRRWR